MNSFLANKFWLSVRKSDLSNIRIHPFFSRKSVSNYKTNKPEGYEGWNEIAVLMYPDDNENRMGIVWVSNHTQPTGDTPFDTFTFSKLRKPIESKFCYFQYDENKYVAKTITANVVVDVVSPVNLSTYLDNKNFLVICDIIQSNYKVADTKVTCDITIKYLEKK